MSGPPSPFTAHNVLLPDGTQTLPARPLLADEPETLAMLRTLRLHAPPAADGSTRVVDLGTLEGGYAVALARAGYDVLAIEARATNLRRCEWLAEELAGEVPNLRFVQDDVRNVARYGSFDVAFCSGLLYHLDRPATFLKALGAVTDRLLLLHTHYAIDGDQTAYGLSELTEHDGRLGRWYPEYAPDATAAQVESDPWASFGNHASFWLEKKHLLQSVVDAGFPVVYEQFDFVEDIAGNPYLEQEFRSLFVGVVP